MKVGDVILTKDKSLLARGIQLFMKKHRKKLGLPKATTYNHVGVCIENDGDIMIAESAINGVQIKYTPEQYLLEHPSHKIMTWVKPLTEFERERFSDTAVGFSRIVTRYDFINFIPQIRMVLFGAWTGKTGDKSKKRLYCSELGAVCMDSVRGSFGGVTWSVNPLMIEMCKDLKPAYSL